jgi:hypothetical protein
MEGQPAIPFTDPRGHAGTGHVRSYGQAEMPELEHLLSPGC